MSFGTQVADAMDFWCFFDYMNRGNGHCVVKVGVSGFIETSM